MRKMLTEAKLHPSALHSYPTFLLAVPTCKKSPLPRHLNRLIGLSYRPLCGQRIEENVSSVRGVPLYLRRQNSNLDSPGTNPASRVSISCVNEAIKRSLWMCSTRTKEREPRCEGKLSKVHHATMLSVLLLFDCPEFVGGGSCFIKAS